MVSQSLADDEGVSKPSSSLPSRQPLGRNPPSESSSPRSEDISGRAVGLPDLPVESTGGLRHPVEKPSISQSLLSASEVQHTVTPGDSSVPQPINSDVDTVGLPGVSVDSTGDQHHPITTRFTPKSTSSSPASQSQKTVPLGDDMLHSGNLEEDLRPQDLPLPPSPALEVRRSFESGAGSAHHDSGSDSSQQDVRLKRQSGSFGSDESEYGSQDDRRSYVSRFRASPRVLHRAWTTTGDDYKYRHIVTGEIFHHRWREPQKPGPSADDIPDGWTAQLVSEDEEDWIYVHDTTSTVINVPPKTLPEAVVKQFDLAATYGIVPHNCQGQLEHGQLMYKCINPSKLCPIKWRTANNPEVIETKMNQWLANVESNSTTPATVTFLAKSGQQIPFDFETGDISQMSGILLITDIDKVVCNQLLATQIHTPLISFFIICHLLLATLHGDEATKELARQAQGWWWMSTRSDTDDTWWSGNHFDIMYDDESSILHFGFAQYPNGRLDSQNNISTTRLSAFQVASDMGEYMYTIFPTSSNQAYLGTRIVMVLIGNVTLDSALIQNDPHAMDFGRPRWWMPAVPAYLGLSSSTQPGIRSYLIRLLGVVAQDLAATGLPRISRDDREADLDKILEAFVPYRLAMSTWKDGVHFLKGEIDYFWEQAINGPNVSDFVRLKASKRYAEVLYQDLGAWMVNMEGLLVPDVDRGGARAMNELKDLLGQILAFKQEIGDTFQLLIGAITIKDSEIQKKLAQESKLQARRSTALTALAAIYLPLSLTTGVFGMNIVEIEEGKPKYWAAVAVAVGLLVATLPFLVWVYLDKDEQGWNRARSTVSAEHPANSQRHQVEKDGGTLSKSHSQDFEPRPLDLVRRRTTRYSQMNWTVTGGSQPDSTRRTAHPEHMV